jgi:hypothetical protein
MDPFALLLLVIGASLLWVGLRVWVQPRITNAAWRWHQSIQGLPATAGQFYGRVQEGLQSGFEVREVPLKGLGFGPSGLFETRSLLSERQTYLEIRYKDVCLYLYAAETPHGLFVSEWLFSKYLTWLRYPILKYFAGFYFSWQTLFQFDAVLMLGEAVHAAVLAVLDDLAAASELKPIPEPDRRPVLHAFYGGAAPAQASPSRRPLPQ